jgi:hypothetical protein
VKPKLKEKWVKALRSGRYKQTTGVLSEHDSSGREANCCLGVLCRVARLRKDNWRDWGLLSDFDSGYALLEEHDFNEQPLASLNDEGKSFSEIADYIEENL